MGKARVAVRNKSEGTVFVRVKPAAIIRYLVGNFGASVRVKPGIEAAVSNTNKPIADIQTAYQKPQAAINYKGRT